jgi:hypothetical protein
MKIVVEADLEADLERNMEASWYTLEVKSSAQAYSWRGTPEVAIHPRLCWIELSHRRTKRMAHSQHPADY